MPTNLSGTVRPKTFDRKTWYPLLYINFADTTIFLEHCKDAHDFFRLCETKVFWRKNMILPFFIRRIFLKRELLSKAVAFVYKNFRQGETKNSRQKKVIPPNMHKIFCTPIYLKHLRKAHVQFPHCETENFWRQFVIASIMHKLFRLPQNFLKHWRDADEFFRHCET